MAATKLALFVGILCIFAAQAFFITGPAVSPPAVRQTKHGICMTAKKEQITRRVALFSVLFGSSLIAARSDALELIPPALRDAARGGRREVAVEPEPVEAPPPPPKPSRRPARKTEPAPEPSSSASETSDAEKPIPRAVQRKMEREARAKAAREAREAAEKAADSAPPVQRASPRAPPRSEPTEEFKITKQAAPDKQKFENTEVNSLEEKLKKRAASKIDAQLNKLQSDIGEKDFSKVPSLIPK